MGPSDATASTRRRHQKERARVRARRRRLTRAARSNSSHRSWVAHGREQFRAKEHTCPLVGEVLIRHLWREPSSYLIKDSRSSVALRCDRIDATASSSALTFGSSMPGTTSPSAATIVTVGETFGSMLPGTAIPMPSDKTTAILSDSVGRSRTARRRRVPRPLWGCVPWTIPNFALNLCCLPSQRG